MEPAAFAAELISRLEKLKQEQETMDSLEERLQQIKEVGGLTLLGPGRARRMLPSLGGGTYLAPVRASLLHLCDALGGTGAGNGAGALAFIWWLKGEEEQGCGRASLAQDASISPSGFGQGLPPSLMDEG